MLMVEHVLKNWHQIYDELIRWKEILETPYSKYLST